MNAAVEARLARLAPDQRRAATTPPGPILCIAPAGSGKTTTLVARIAWLVDQGVNAAEICALTFNRRAAEELRDRIAPALAPLGEGLGEQVRIRTFHALGLEILRDAGRPVEPLLGRDEVLRAARPDISAAERRRLDTILSRFKLDLRIDPAAVAADPQAGPTARVFVDYEAEVARRGGLDFDDLVARTLALLEHDAATLTTWRGRCRHLLVDESQDLDRSQLELALLLAAPDNRIFLVGDDDQSIYGWRLADVRRLLGLADAALPDLHRVDLEVNYRCPAVVLERAVRLIEHNSERFAKTIRAGPNAAGRLVLAGSPADDLDRAAAVLRSLPEDGSTRAVLARTNRELVPAAIAAIRHGTPFRAADLVLPIESPVVDEVLAELGAGDAAVPLVAALAGVRRRRARAHLHQPDDGMPDPDSVVAAMLGWAAGCRDLADLSERIGAMRASAAALRRDDALLSLATAHGTKGLEFDHVVVVGLEAGRFPSARSVAEAVEPDRALQEERRLAYVAWTRARRTLTLVYDPGSPSQFLLEAFTPEELGLAA